MVTDEERDYMYAEYAKDPRMSSTSVRRRLAPLLDNGRDKIELLHAILFTLPGTPIIYYGDEIGMGDNIYLGTVTAFARRCSGRATGTAASRAPTSRSCISRL